MTETIHNKLVRDKIPEIIRENGDQPLTRILTPEEYKTALFEKLVEEAIELRDSKGDLDERADVAEVLRSLDAALDFNPEAVEGARRHKANERGGFADGILLEKVVRNA